MTFKKSWSIIGVIIVLLIIVFLLLPSTGKGTLVLQLTDAPPGDNITSVIVSLSDIEVHFAGDSVITGNQVNNETIDDNTTEDPSSGSGWFTVVEGPVTYDLIEIQDVFVLLGEAELDAGKYTQIRLNVDSATAMINGEEVDLTIPSGTVRLVRNFDIVPGGNTTLTLDFEADDSIIRQGNGVYRMKPVITLLAENEQKPVNIDYSSKTNKNDCELAGGGWIQGQVGEGCAAPTEDAGKTCTDSDQCETICLPDPYDAEEGEEINGLCYGYVDTGPFCGNTVEDGIVTGPEVCP